MIELCWIGCLFVRLKQKKKMYWPSWNLCCSSVDKHIGISNEFKNHFCAHAIYTVSKCRLFSGQLRKLTGLFFKYDYWEEVVAGFNKITEIVFLCLILLLGAVLDYCCIIACEMFLVSIPLLVLILMSLCSINICCLMKEAGKPCPIGPQPCMFSNCLCLSHCWLAGSGVFSQSEDVSAEMFWKKARRKHSWTRVAHPCLMINPHFN